MNANERIKRYIIGLEALNQNSESDARYSLMIAKREALNLLDGRTPFPAMSDGFMKTRVTDAIHQAQAILDVFEEAKGLPV